LHRTLNAYARLGVKSMDGASQVGCTRMSVDCVGKLVAVAG